jgi:transcriptional antiterminator RfaH
MKYWIVATYKINEIKRVKSNLANQNFEYYSPKITTKKINSSPKKEALFPGYIFINTALDNYSSVKYTKGIKNVIKFGQNISYITDDEIKSINMLEESSTLDPFVSKIKIGQEMLIKSGSLKGNFVKICSLPAKKRVDVFLYFLGSLRRMSIPEKDLTL